MHSLLRRVRRLEASRVDASGLVPHSDAWYAFYENVLDGMFEGKKPGMRMPIEVADRIMAMTDDEASCDAP
jgi:hypothetical protein